MGVIGSGAATRPLPETREGSTDRVRALRPDDIAEIVALRQQVFRFSERPTPADLAAHFDRVFLQNPWRTGEVPSLVCEDDQGRIAGFLGVVPRRMVFRGVRLNVAVGTQFMVRPETRCFAGSRLARALIGGSHDLVLSDTANDAARRIWERVGGTTSGVHSLFWTRPLRPWRHAAGRAAGGPVTRALAWSARPMLGALDRVAGRRWSRPIESGTTGRLDTRLMLMHFNDVAGDRSLQPLYDERSWDWLLARVAEKRAFGDMHHRAVWGEGGVIAGWFVYSSQRGGEAQVVQLAARPGAAGLVLDHLFHHAWTRGVAAVSGRLEPTLLPELVARGCTFRREGPWMLLHARNPQIVRAIEQGDAFLSRLEGEWWMSF